MNRPYLNFSTQDILERCLQAIFQKDELLELRDEISFRKDRCKKVASALINFAIRLNNSLSLQNVAPKQPNPEYLTLDQAYDVLGVQPDTCVQEITTMRTKLLQACDPSKRSSECKRLQKFVENESQLIVVAYDLILQSKAFS